MTDDDKDLKQATAIKNDQDFEQFVYADETLQSRIKKASQPFDLGMDLRAHVSEIESEIEANYRMYYEARKRFIQLKKERDQELETLLKLDSSGVFSKIKQLTDATDAYYLIMIKNLESGKAIQTPLCYSALKFSFRTMGKSFKDNLKDMIDERFEKMSPQLVELLYIMQQAGLNPMQRIQERMKQPDKFADEPIPEPSPTQPEPESEQPAPGPEPEEEPKVLAIPPPFKKIGRPRKDQTKIELAREERIYDPQSEQSKEAQDG